VAKCQITSSTTLNYVMTGKHRGLYVIVIGESDKDEFYEQLNQVMMRPPRMT